MPPDAITEFETVQREVIAAHEKIGAKAVNLTAALAKCDVRLKLKGPIGSSILTV